MSDMNDLLDATLDDLEDLPEFKPFAPGAHRVLATMEEKEINGKQAIELSFKMMETLELADPQDEAPKEGDTSNTMFMLDNEYGRGNLKKCGKPFGDALGLTTLREIVEGVKEVECVIITSVRPDKNDPDKKYLQVKEIQVV
jgi:hypothetical protein